MAGSRRAEACASARVCPRSPVSLNRPYSRTNLRSLPARSCRSRPACRGRRWRSLRRADAVRPRFAVRVTNETRHIQLVAHGPRHFDYSRKKVVSLYAVITARAEATLLKSCVLNRTDMDRCARASRRVPCNRERCGCPVLRAPRKGSLCDVCW